MSDYKNTVQLGVITPPLHLMVKELELLPEFVQAEIVQQMCRDFTDIETALMNWLVEMPVSNVTCELLWNRFEGFFFEPIDGAEPTMASFVVMAQQAYFMATGKMVAPDFVAMDKNQYCAYFDATKGIDSISFIPNTLSGWGMRLYSEDAGFTSIGSRTFS